MLCFYSQGMSGAKLFFRRPSGMWGIFVIWVGQMVSGIASSITAVALPIWIFDLTGSGIKVGLLEFFFFGSYLLFIQVAGVLIDRYNRKLMMLVYDFLTLFSLIVLLTIQATGKLAPWHLYVAAVFQGVGYAFYAPSYLAAITTMVSRKQYVRANGLMSLLNDAPEIFGPIMAGALVIMVGLNGILAINIIALIFSIGSLLIVEVPAMPHTTEGEMSRGRLAREMVFGIKYIIKRPGLLGLQLVFFFGNFLAGIALSVAALYPMMLLRTGGNTEVVGTILSAGALAAVLTGLLLSMWGRLKWPIHAILWGWILSSLFGLIPLGAGETAVVWLTAYVVISIFTPVINVSMDTFLQMKIPPDLQGRVSSATDFIAQAMIPFTPLIAGLLGDKFFEPAMQSGGFLADTFGPLVGTGPGSGFGLMILLCGVACTVMSIIAYMIPSIRNLKETMPDFIPLPPVGLVKRSKPLLRR
jgi:MFS transporter, DHA3 family, macrolide efflux protein